MRKRPENSFNGRRRTVAVAWLTGVSLSFLWEAFVGSLEVGSFAIKPGNLAAVLLVVLALPISWNRGIDRWAAVWILVSTVAITDQVPIAIVASGFEVPIWVWLAGAAASLVLTGLAMFSMNRRLPVRKPHLLEVLAATTVIFAVIGVFQMFNRAALASGVPNEERSLMVSGVEVHHITWGVPILAVAVVLFWRFGEGRLGAFARALILGLGSGLIVDEWLYMSLRDVSDVAYFEPITWVSALAMAAALPGLWWWLGKRTPVKGHPLSHS